MSATLALIAGLALAGADAKDAATIGVAVPDGVLAPQVAASPIKGPPAPSERIVVLRDDRFAPQAERAGVLVGNAAWYEQKFSADPILRSDHGEPMVVFTSGGPALPR